MNETQVHEDSAQSADEAPAISVFTPAAAAASQVVVPAQACPSCSAAAARATTQAVPDPWVYVIGDVDARYPSLSVEKEALGAMARAKLNGLSNDAALQAVLAAPENAYLVREMCFVLLVQEVETYLLAPRSPLDYPMLVEASKTELSAVIGTLGPVADPSVCNGLTLPYLIFDVIYNFDKPALMADMPLPKGAEEAKFRAAATDIFNQAASLIPTGRGMERALAYLALKDPRFYEVIWNAFNQNAQLTSIEMKAVPFNSAQSLNLVDVIVCTTDRSTGVPSCVYARVALAKLPHVVNYWQPYIRQ
jgi:hypothetical protein